MDCLSSCFACTVKAAARATALAACFVAPILAASAAAERAIWRLGVGMRAGCAALR